MRDNKILFELKVIHMPEEAPLIAPLENFISDFNHYELNRELFDLRDEHGVQWWDLVRYQVQLALCIERDIYGRPAAVAPHKRVRIQSFIRQALRLTRDAFRIHKRKIQHARALVVSRRSLDYINDVTAADTRNGRSTIFVNKNGDTQAPHVAITSQSIQFFIRLTYRMQRIPDEVERDARQVADDLRSHFNSEVNIYGIIAKKYQQELVSRWVWSFILDRACGLERVLYVYDDTLKSLVLLARSRGIDTEEVQHAYMGRTHIAFSYPQLDGGLMTLPDKVIVTRDTGDITYPVTHVFATTKTKPRVPVPRTIDVLIGSSPSRRQETAEVVASLVGQGLRVALKLHPSETKDTSAIVTQYSSEEIVIYAGEEDFCDLAWQTHVFIPVNATSTTAFEAAEMGARVVLIDIGGVKKTAVTDGVASARAGSMEALPEVVHTQLRAAATEIIKKGRK